MKMRKLWSALSVLILASGLHAGYMGFKTPDAGEWVVVVYHNPDGSDMEQKMIYLGETRMKGKTAEGIEMQMKLPQNNGINATQVWIGKKDRDTLKYVMSMNGQLMCVTDQSSGMVPEMQESPPSTETPEAYDPAKHPVLKSETYTTPTGKKVHAAVYKEGSREVWVSSEIPFGIVKVVDNGKTVAYLKDFGKGAKPAIPVEEAKACQPMDFGNMLKGFGF